MRARNNMPDDVRAALESARVMDDYLARPAYQRNDYLGWITRAARAETRTKRIAQMIAELAQGGVYMKMQHPPSAKSCRLPRPHSMPRCVRVNESAYISQGSA